MHKTILLIEDEEILLEVLQKKLLKEGFAVETARDGLEGLESMKRKRPDLVLLDIIMPRIDGYEVLEKMQKDASLSNIPVIIISNSGQPVEIDRALALGAKDYLIKAQFSPLEVITKVRDALFPDEKESALPSNTRREKQKNMHPHMQGKTKNNGKVIAVIEDDQFLRELIVRKLTYEGYVVQTALDGNEGLQIITEKKPDLVLLDIVMPLKNGFEVLKAVREHPDTLTKRIPVIMLSNLGQEADIKKGKVLGATDYLVKASLTTDQIVKKIREYL